MSFKDKVTDFFSKLFFGDEKLLSEDTDICRSDPSESIPPVSDTSFEEVTNNSEGVTNTARIYVNKSA